MHVNYNYFYQKMEVFRIFLLFATPFCTVNAYKILVVSPIPGKSHSILGDGLVRHLANAGHEIYYITAYVPKKTHQNVTILDVSNNHELFGPMMEKFLDFESLLDKKGGVSDFFTLLKAMVDVGTGTINNPNVISFLKDKNQQVDLVLIEWMYTEIYSGLQAIFDCPFIWFSTVEPHWRVMRLIDEIPNPAYTTDHLVSSFPPFTFTQRAHELGMQIFGLFLEKFIVLGPETRQYQENIVPIIEARGKVAPAYEVLRFNASLTLGNSHISLGLPFRLPDSYKGIGGYHIEEDVKPLPKDLQKILDESSQGLIYFSMGSNLRSKTLPTQVKSDLLKMFGQLKQTVLWKFEEDLPDRPKNVHIVDWAPQPSILAHPNCILFITHGGLLSTTETIHFGVPVIGIPVFADQFMNIQRAVKKGIAIQVDLSYKMAYDLKVAIDEVLSNPSYTEKAKHLSFIYHDRPVSPGKELVHWVEHVIRTNGAPHLRSPALMVPWYQKMYLDLAAVLLVILLVIARLVKLPIRVILKPDIKKKQH